MKNTSKSLPFFQMDIIKIVLILFILGGIGLSSFRVNQTKKTTERKVEKTTNNSEFAKIKVMNFGTFHMGYSSDAHTEEFDQYNRENQQRVHEIAKKLAAFRPTVILVESIPEDDALLQKSYQQYLENPAMTFKHPSEIELLAFELGRLCETKKIHGIDHRMGYQYNIGDVIDNTVDSEWYNKLSKDAIQYFPEVNVDEEKFSLLDKLILRNKDSYFDFLMTVNADMLTLAGTDNHFEGADEATKFYQRNLRMYSNMNRIKLKEDDRVFILLGAAHAAFFRDFMKRSPKYDLVNTLDYLK